jgi:hypothetical protein
MDGHFAAVSPRTTREEYAPLDFLMLINECS